MEDQVAEIIIKVHLVNGKVMIHTYQSPKTESEIKELLKELLKKMFVVSRKRADEPLEFDNPIIFYNSNNVMCIEIGSVGVKELEEIMSKARAKIGF
jgi:type IV secretory pathway ATPase VirB11/archaellum biosynthesis ATPase